MQLSSLIESLSALSAAAAGGHLNIADLCLPQLALEQLPRSKGKGWGPLHFAAANGHPDMISFLLKNGVSAFDTAYDGSTAADLARRHGHYDIVRLLETPTDTSKYPARPTTGKNLRVAGMLISLSPTYLILELTFS
jgi:hypothetical protein